ncbi:MAG: nucleotidyltransferase family protein [Oryzihumus sp.]
MKVAGVVLAAGAGVRLGRPKAQVVVDGRRLVDLVVDACARAGLDPVVVVTGAAAVEPEPLAETDQLDSAEVVVVHNPEWETGQASSLRAGLAAVGARPDVDALVVTLVDTPGVGAGHLRRVVAALADGATAAVAAYRGQQRTPVGLVREVWAEVADVVHGDEGARVWLRAHQGLVTPVECGDLGPWRDIDVPADLPS